MAYKADISSQPLTPSAPDVSGAVAAIKSTAGIANTIFGGVEKAYEISKREMLKSATEEGRQAQADALFKHETFLKDEQQAFSNVVSANSDVQSFQQSETIDPFQQEKFVNAAKTQLIASAERLKTVREAGGFKQTEYFSRVRDLVDKYAAEFPEAKDEIRKVVGEATGLPGADLWAQQQFIRRMFTPQDTKVESDAVAKKAEEKELELVSTYTKNISPTDLLNIQRNSSSQWKILVKSALEQDAMVKDKNTIANQVARNVAVTDEQFKQQGDLLLRSADLAAGISTARFVSQNFDKFSNLENKLASGAFTDQDQAEAANLFKQMEDTVVSAFARNAIEVENSANPNVSAAARQEVLARLKNREELVLKLLKTSSQSQTVEAMKMFILAKDKNIERRVKLSNAWAQLTSAVGSDTTVRAALSVPEYKDGKMTPEWENVQSKAPKLIPLLREYQLFIEDSPLTFGGKAQNASALSVALEDAASNPDSTAENKRIPSKDIGGAAQGVALFGASIVAQSRNSRLKSDKALQIGASLNNDANVVGTTLSNAALGHGLNIISQNEEDFKDFISKLDGENKERVSYSISNSYQKSLQSAKEGIDVISKKYGLKSPLQLGFTPTGTLGLVPPPKEWLEPASKAKRAYISIPENIRKYYKDPTKYYGGETMVFKPEFLEEATQWAKAIEEWENKYLPRVVGSLSARSVVEGKDKLNLARTISNEFKTPDVIKGFYSFSNIPEEVVSETPQQVEVNLKGIGKIANPSIAKLTEIAKLPTTPPDVSRNIIAIIEDMTQKKEGVITNQSKK